MARPDVSNTLTCGVRASVCTQLVLHVQSNYSLGVHASGWEFNPCSSSLPGIGLQEALIAAAASPLRQLSSCGRTR